MGDAASRPATPAAATATAPAGWSELGAGGSQRSIHDEALGWVKIHMCRQHLVALLKCTERGTDCFQEKAAVESCKQANERAAWRQLEMNGVVQCPQQFKAYSDCMGLDTRGGTASPSDEEHAKCRGLWIAMHQCAAEHVVRHVEAQQAERTDGGFTPPPMFHVQRTQRRRVAPEDFFFSRRRRHTRF